MNGSKKSANNAPFQNGEEVHQAIRETGEMLQSEMQRIFNSMETATASGSDQDKKDAVLGIIKDELYKGFVGFGMRPKQADDMKEVILESIDFLIHNVSKKDLQKFENYRQQLKQERNLMKIHAEIAQKKDRKPDEELNENELYDFKYATRKEIEGIYATAYKFYNSGRYSDAANLFKLLVGLRAKDHRFHFGLASCLMMTEKFQEAVGHFVLSHHLKQDQPLALFFLAKCNVKLKNLPEAKQGFLAAKELMGNRPEFVEHIKHANSMIELIDKKLEPKK